MHGLCPLVSAALIVAAAVSNAVAQPATAGMVSSPRPPTDAAAEARLTPIDDLFMTPAASPEAFWANFATLQAIVLAGDAERNRAQQPADSLAGRAEAEALQSADASAVAPVTVARREALLRQVAASVAATRARPPGATQLAPPPTPRTTSRAWDTAERIALWPASPPGGTFVPATLPADWPAPFVLNVASPELRVFPAPQPTGQAVLVIPGGGYQFVSVENEGADFAARLNARGYTVFVLVYRLPSEGWQRGEDVPLQDAQRAMRVIRANAARWKIEARTLAVVGFSAGGHLAATLTTGFAEPVYVPVDAADAASARPFAAALIYPVVTMALPGTHPTSRELLLGPNPTSSQIARRSAERHVGADTPPLLLVHAIDDTAVPVSNSLNLLTAMRAADRPVEAHFFQEGGHAFASGYPNSPTSSWIGVFDAWLARLRASQ